MHQPDEEHPQLPLSKVAAGTSWLWSRALLNPLFFAAATTIAAIVAADRIGWEQRWIWLLLLAFLSAAALRWQNRVCFLGGVAVSFALLHSSALRQAATTPHATPGSLSTSGTIVSTPQKPADSEATLFRLATKNLGTFLVRVDEGGRDLESGDKIALRGQLSPRRQLRNPNQFNTSDFLHRNRLSGKIAVEDDLSIDLLEHGSGTFSLHRLADRCRSWLSASITSGIPPADQSSAVIKSMVLGASDSAPPELEEPFRYSGTMHLFAISGLHVGIFTSILWFVLRLLGVRKDYAAAILIPAVFFYAFITGWRPSAVRAAVMLSVVLIGSATNRQPRLFNSLGAAAIIVLVWDTHQAFKPGFQLSFTVLFAIALLADPFRAISRHLSAPDPFIPRPLLSKRAKTNHAIANYLGTYISVSLAAWLGSLYPVWHHFGLITPVSVIANLVLIPASFTILSLAALSVSVSPLPHVALPLVLNKTNAVLASTVLAVAGWFASLPGAHFHLPKTRLPDDTCNITVLDVGFGGACNVIEPPGAHATLIDTGSEFDFHEIVRRFLTSHGINRTGFLFLTHPDTHHVGGATRMSSFAPPSRIYSTQQAQAARIFSPMVEAGHQISSTAGGETIKIARSTEMEILYPPPEFRSSVADNGSLVARLHHGPWKILFMSDAGFETEKFLIDSGLDLRSHVIVMGRHRSDHSGTNEFIRAVSPAALVTTSSVFPEHENVSGTWRNDIMSLGIRLFDQSFSGAITIEASPESLTLRPFARGEPLVLSAPALTSTP